MIRADEFRHTIRRGHKTGTASSLISVVPTAQDLPVRFGFVVGKKVGNSVVRNRIRRRMRAAAYALVREGLSGYDVVLRGIAASPEATVSDFERDLRRVILR